MSLRVHTCMGFPIDVVQTKDRQTFNDHEIPNHGFDSKGNKTRDNCKHTCQLSYDGSAVGVADF